MDMRLPSLRLHCGVEDAPSRKRKAGRDRIDGAHDCAVNLKAETRIMALHEKRDEIRFQKIILLREKVRERAEPMRRMALIADVARAQ